MALAIKRLRCITSRATGEDTVPLFGIPSNGVVCLKPFSMLWKTLAVFKKTIYYTLWSFPGAYALFTAQP